MIAQGLTVPALIALGANIWTTNDNALYTSGLGLSNITKVRKKPMVVIAGIIGTVLSIWLYNNFVGWLNFLNTALPPVGALISLDFFLHKSDYESGEEAKKEVKWGSVIGVICGALAGNLIPGGIASINAMIVAVICYFVVGAIAKD